MRLRIHITCLLLIRSYINFRKRLTVLVLHVYFRGLISTVQHYADVVSRACKDLHAQIQRCFESVEFIFKFIVQSHILFARAACGEMKDSFSKNIHFLFVSLNRMLNDDANSETDIVPIQVI